MSVIPLAALLFVSVQRYWTPDVKWDELGLQNYRALLSSSGPAGEALRNSLWLGAVGSVVGVLAALWPAARAARWWWVGRGSRACRARARVGSGG